MGNHGKFVLRYNTNPPCKGRGEAGWSATRSPLDPIMRRLMHNISGKLLQKVRN
ncbi:hypothetical protein MBAV_001603 [Candidatus Magnetobacterium bavaricum]|uniref:Uncharacterized protein n=1 Tax=Candidatus Magnetobacterium bavaricum TaxID=29290 RepID=A0A0F3GWH0_9BACT|nr:hypothetical protein MBAV_001603 [Candidatus Magnetobacterium bavaricum]